MSNGRPAAQPHIHSPIHAYPTGRDRTDVLSTQPMADEMHHMVMAQPTRVISSGPVAGRSHTSPGATDRLAFHRKKATIKATSGAMTRAIAWRPFRKVATPLIGEDHWRSMNTCLPHDDAPYTNDGMRLHPCRQGHFVPNSSHHHAEIQPAEEWYVPRNRRH